MHESDLAWDRGADSVVRVAVDFDEVHAVNLGSNLGERGRGFGDERLIDAVGMYLIPDLASVLSNAYVEPAAAQDSGFLTIEGGVDAVLVQDRARCGSGGFD